VHAVRTWLLSETVAGRAHSRFAAEMLQPLWDAAERYGIDPLGLTVQAGKETGWGRYGGQVKPEFRNTCGLKNRWLGLYPGVDDGDQPLAHARFASWEVGAIAHAQHVRAYTGVPTHDLIIDPRWDWVFGKHRLVHWSELGGRWAPSPTYGQEIEKVASLIAGRVL
jgi:hypothetical protein